MALPAGIRLGPYAIVAPLGRGGMGEVYRAIDTRLGRTVAIKVLPVEVADSPVRRQRFEREARAISRLTHPLICTLYDIGECEPASGVDASAGCGQPVPYLVMEYLEGETLAARLIRGPLPIDHALRHALDIADALDHAHRHDVIHRDLKPANIMLTRTGVKLLDFGIATFRPGAAGAGDPTKSPTIATLTEDGTLLGTPLYMAPEQLRGHDADARTDLFAFGAVAHEMITGRPVFEAPTPAAIIAAVLEREPAALGSARIGVPPMFDRVIMRCLAKAPDDRWQTAHDLRQALVWIADGAVEAAVPAAPTPAGQRADLERSIAVLPFANLGADRETDYFSDGLTDEIINLLARVQDLKVIARTSSFAFRGREDDVRRIAQVLGVRTVLEGSVRRSANRIRVTVQLIDAADGCPVWSERYDRELVDVFAMQDEIAGAIGASLRTTLVSRSVTPDRYRPNLPAYDAFLKGQYWSARMTPDALARSVEWFEKATTLDRDYALAYAGMATAFLLRATYGMQRAHEAMPRARAAAQRALDLDGSLPEAHVVLGVVAAVYDYDWNQGSRHFDRAKAQHPVSPYVRAMCGGYSLLALGQFDAAAEETALALQQDPLNLLWRHHLTWALLWSGRDAAAIDEANRILEIDDTFFLAHFDLGLAHLSRGRLDASIASAERACQLAPWNDVMAGLLGGVLRIAGKRVDDRIAKLTDAAANHEPLGLLIFHLVASNVDEAADACRRAIDERLPGLVYFLRCPLAARLRSSTRWPEIARMMNLSENA
jgi:eukaryotic-like serine/threonine-protein kinase